MRSSSPPGREPRGQHLAWDRLLQRSARDLRPRNRAAGLGAIEHDLGQRLTCPSGTVSAGRTWQAALHAYNALSHETRRTTRRSRPPRRSETRAPSTPRWPASGRRRHTAPGRESPDPARPLEDPRRRLMGWTIPGFASVLYSLAKVQRRRRRSDRRTRLRRSAVHRDRRALGLHPWLTRCEQYRWLGPSARAVGDRHPWKQVEQPRIAEFHEDAFGPDELAVVAHLRVVRPPFARTAGVRKVPPTRWSAAVAVEQLSLGEDHPRLRDALERLEHRPGIRHREDRPGSFRRQKTARGGRFARKPPRPVTLWVSARSCTAPSRTVARPRSPRS